MHDAGNTDTFDSEFRSVDPATGATLGQFETVPEATAASIADEMFHRPLLNLDSRIAQVRGVGEALRQGRASIADVLVAEIGKPLTQALAEIDKSADFCSGFPAFAVEAFGSRSVELPDAEAFVRLEPLGPILGIMPWNFPVWQTLRFAIPNLLLGNPCIVKPAPNASLSHSALDAVFRAAGVGPESYRTVRATNETIANLISLDSIAGVSLTGSVAAGRTVGGLVGAAIKPQVLELGGSDPFIVDESADVEAAAIAAARSRLLNNGQSCVCAKRFIIHDAVYEQFLERFVYAMSSARLAPPAQETCELGPLARYDLRAALHDQVIRSTQKGATTVCGGVVPDGPGWYYPATVLVDVPADAPVWVEEVFGPVAPVMRVGDIDEAVAVANATDLGLGASVWTEEGKLADRISSNLQTGMVFVNDIVRSDWRLPFGGTKRSGVGRELGLECLMSFANVRTVVGAGAPGQRA